MRWEWVFRRIGAGKRGRGVVVLEMSDRGGGGGGGGGGGLEGGEEGGAG